MKGRIGVINNTTLQGHCSPSYGSNGHTRLKMELSKGISLTPVKKENTKKKEEKMSFICMYRNTVARTIAAATDGFETRWNPDGTVRLLNDRATKIISDPVKKVLITFCGCMELDGIRTEDCIRRSLDAYAGTDIEELFGLLERNLTHLNHYEGFSSVLVGYFSEFGTPIIGSLDISHVNGVYNKKIIKNSQNDFSRAGKDASYLNQLNDFYFENLKEHAIHTVETVISMENLSNPPEKRTVGGLIQSDMLSWE